MQVEKSTDELDEILKNTTVDGLDDYYKENKGDMACRERPFYSYMKEMYRNKRFLLKDIYITVGVSESYGEKILRLEKHTDNRDLIIRFCLAGHFDLIQTNRALKLYGFSELYARDDRDVCIIVAINNRIFDPERVNDILQKKNFIPLVSVKCPECVADLSIEDKREYGC